MTPDLKPCPFCGGAAEVENLSKPERERHITVSCTNEQCFAYAPSVYFAREADAITAWNRRPAPLYTQDQLDAAVKAEREACAKIARLRGSEANWLWNDNVEPEKNMIRRDEAYAIEAAIRARGE